MLKLATLGILALFVTAAPQDDKATYAVVVNTKNACKETGDKVKAIVKKLFLKQLTQWPDGTDARPYARKQGTAETTEFTKSVLGMSDAELARHWLKLKNMDGTTPPKAVGSDRMILKYVAKHEGALGVVKIEDAKECKDVKILFEF